jgi:hypothetical protein
MVRRSVLGLVFAGLVRALPDAIGSKNTACPAAAHRLLLNQRLSTASALPSQGKQGGLTCHNPVAACRGGARAREGRRWPLAQTLLGASLIFLLERAIWAAGGYFQTRVPSAPAGVPASSDYPKSLPHRKSFARVLIAEAHQLSM